jgi:hypothetical protein
MSSSSGLLPEVPAKRRRIDAEEGRIKTHRPPDQIVLSLYEIIIQRYEK